MNLFITDDYILSNSHISIKEPRIIHQCLRVLRMNASDTLQLQDNYQRHTITLLELSKQSLEGIITSSETLKPPKTTTIYLALPNRRSKAELMTQKLTEIGISNIVFGPSQRSILRKASDNKQQRIRTIALEASEQSFRADVPSITFLEKLDKNTIFGQNIVLFNQQGDSYLSKSQSYDSGIIGPEGGWTDEELEYLGALATTHTIGDTVLRTETAAIIGGWLLTQ